MGAWVELRDSAEAAAVLYGNYLLPGSSMVTKHLVSDGAEEKLDSDWGKLAQLGTGGGGIADGNLANYTGGEGAGTPLPSFLGGPAEASSGLDLGGPGSSPASWMGGGETIDPNTVSGIDLGGPGSSPANTGGTDWAGKAQNWAKQKALEQGIQQAVGGNKQQAAPADSSTESSTTTQQSDFAEKNARRQALMEKAQKLRERIAALRAQVARESSIPQTVLGNPA